MCTNVCVFCMHVYNYVYIGILNDAICNAAAYVAMYYENIDLCLFVFASVVFPS